MNSSKQRYDKKVKVTRILLNDYLVLVAISKQAGISMAEALHRLIEHEAQLPLLNRITRPTLAAQVTNTPPPAIRVTAIPISAVNGSKAAAFGTKVKGVRYE